MLSDENELSPAFGASEPAFELKFLVDAERAHAISAFARECLSPDAHGDPAQQGAYATTSLYCDTPELDVFRRSPSYRRRKFRVRRYGVSTLAFLERKTKSADLVRKVRTPITEDELRHLEGGESSADWPGLWFQRSLTERRLQPACLVRYERTAFIGDGGSEGPLRLTMDRGLQGVLISNWSFHSNRGGLELLPGQVILELKFRTALPLLFKELVRKFALQPGGVSKYRLCRRAWGAALGHGDVAHA